MAEEKSIEPSSPSHKFRKYLSTEEKLLLFKINYYCYIICL